MTNSPEMHLVEDESAVVIRDALGKIDVSRKRLSVRIGQVGTQHRDLVVALALDGEGDVVGAVAEADAFPLEAAYSMIPN